MIGIFVNVTGKRTGSDERAGGGEEEGEWTEEAIFGRISHHPFGPQCSREFATLHISCRKQQFPSLSRIDWLPCRPAGWLSGYFWCFLPQKTKNARYHLIVFIYDYWLGSGASTWRWHQLGSNSGIVGWVNDRLKSSMGLFQTAFDWRRNRRRVVALLIKNEAEPEERHCDRSLFFKLYRLALTHADPVITAQVESFYVVWYLTRYVIILI